MRYLLIILFVILTFQSTGQALSDVKSYLVRKDVSTVAKEYYHGKFKVADDSRIGDIIDSVATHNNATRPFYLLLVSRMMAQADGAIAEVLCSSCEQFFEEKPDEFIEFLYSNKGQVYENFKKDWLEAVYSEIAMSHEGEEKQSIELLEKRALKKCHLKNKKRLQAFYSEIYRKL